MQTIYTFSYTPGIATGTNKIGTNWRMAYQQPITLYKGTTNTIKIVVFASNQHVVDLTNFDVQIQVVDKESQEHFITKTADITEPLSGIATISFTEDELMYLQQRFYHIIARLVTPNDDSSLMVSEILYLNDNYGAFAPLTVENAWNFQPGDLSLVDRNLVLLGYTGSIGYTGSTGYTGSAGAEMVTFSHDDLSLALTPYAGGATTTIKTVTIPANTLQIGSRIFIAAQHVGLAGLSGASSVYALIDGNQFVSSSVNTEIIFPIYGSLIVDRIGEDYILRPEAATFDNSAPSEPIDIASPIVITLNANATSAAEDNLAGVSYFRVHIYGATAATASVVSVTGYTGSTGSTGYTGSAGAEMVTFTYNDLTGFTISNDIDTDPTFRTFTIPANTLRDGSRIYASGQLVNTTSLVDTVSAYLTITNLTTNNVIGLTGMTDATSMTSLFVVALANKYYLAPVNAILGNASSITYPEIDITLPTEFAWVGNTFNPIDSDVASIVNFEFRIYGATAATANFVSTLGYTGSTGYTGSSGAFVPNNVPQHSSGSSGDLQGMIAFDVDYMYYCMADYDGSTNIWKRIAWTNDVW